MKVSGNYNKNGVPREPSPRGDDLDDKGTADKWKLIFNRNRVGGGDLEVVLFHHEQLPLI